MSLLLAALLEGYKTLPPCNVDKKEKCPTHGFHRIVRRTRSDGEDCKPYEGECRLDEEIELRFVSSDGL